MILKIKILFTFIIVFILFSLKIPNAFAECGFYYDYEGQPEAQRCLPEGSIEFINPYFKCGESVANTNTTECCREETECSNYIPPVDNDTPIGGEDPDDPIDGGEVPIDDGSDGDDDANGDPDEPIDPDQPIDIDDFRANCGQFFNGQCLAFDSGEALPSSFTCSPYKNDCCISQQYCPVYYSCEKFESGERTGQCIVDYENGFTLVHGAFGGMTCEEACRPQLPRIICNNNGYGIWTGLGCVPFQNINFFTADFSTRLLGFAGGLALILISYAAILYMLSGGDPRKLSESKSIILGAITGLILMASAILVFRIVSQGLLGLF